MKKITLFIIAVCLAFMSYSQEMKSLPKILEVNTVETLSKNAVGLTSRERNILENPVNLEVRKIQLANLREVAASSTLKSKGYFKLSLPESALTKASGEILVTPSQIESYDAENYTYFGELLYGAEGKGSLILTKKKGETFGSMILGERIFRISQLESGENLLIELDHSLYNSPAFCPVETEKSTKDFSKTRNSNLNNSNCGSKNVRVLVLFTDRANNVSNPNQLAITVMNELRSATVNSKIYSSSLSYQLVGTQRIGFTESGDAEIDLGNLVANNQLNTLRQNARADLVVVLSDGNYRVFQNGVFVGTVLGIATLNEYSLPNQGHVAIVEADAGNLTFAHEVGHLMGCRHDNDNRSSVPNLSNTAKGHSWFYRNWFLGAKNYQKSMVASGTTQGSRVLYFSNPAVKAHDKARDNTGTSTRNNYQQLRNAASVVACYDPFDDMRVSINGPSTVLEDESINLSASVSNCSSRTYRWEVSQDGFYYSYLGAGSSVNYQPNPLNANTNVSFRLTVTCSDGQVETAFRTVYIFRKDGPFLPAPLSVEDDNTEGPLSVQEQNFLMYPNPASDKVKITVSLSKKQTFRIQAKSLLDGEIYLLHKGKLGAGVQDISANVSSLDQGLYQIDFITENKKVSSKRLLIKR